MTPDLLYAAIMCAELLGMIVAFTCGFLTQGQL